MAKITDIQIRAARLFLVCAYGAIAFFCMRFLLAPALPVLLALCVSAAVSSAAKRLHSLTGLPYPLCAFVLVSLALALCAACVFVVARILLSELSVAISFFSGSTQGCISATLEKLPLVGELAARSEEYASIELAPLISEALSSLASHLGGALASALRATPSAVASALFFVMCVYYMSMDFDGICASVVRFLPRSVRQKGGLAAGACIRLLRAYAHLFLLTFFELLVGLLFICPRVALIASFIIAALDILPVIGAGLVLLPWAAAALVTGNTLSGTGLLLLYAVISIVRRIAEPKILGSGTGLSPVSLLVLMYMGERLFGAVGLLLAPVVGCCAAAAIRAPVKM